jgi:hypothetical protein
MKCIVTLMQAMSRGAASIGRPRILTGAMGDLDRGTQHKQAGWQPLPIRPLARRGCESAAIGLDSAPVVKSWILPFFPCIDPTKMVNSA